MSTGPAHRVQSAAVEYGFPQGHLGHLDDNEDAALRNFRALCAEKGLYKPAEGDKPASHDDATLLRFLRARRFTVKDAYQQFETTENWREANEIDKLYETIDIHQYDDTRQLYPQWTGRRDKRGIPVYVFEVKHLNSKTMAAYEKSAASTVTQAKSDGKTPPKLLRLFALYENLTRFAMPLSTVLPDRVNSNTPITQSNNIVDISGVGLKQFWNLRAHMQDASTLATAHYPETLDRIFIIGAPSFFPTVWSWIKKWFDPITTSKIFILSSSDMKKTLESFIEKQNIPKKYGGELDFEFGYAGPTIDPIFDENFEWKTEKKEFPMGPLLWKKAKKDGHGVLELVAVGSENGEQRNSVIGVLHTTNTEKDLMNMELERPKTSTNGEIKQSSQTLQVPGQGQVAPTPLSSEGESQVFENGELVPASRPRLETFVTASEGTPLSPSYSGPVMDVPDTESGAQQAMEEELANGVETPDEPSLEAVAEQIAVTTTPATQPMAGPTSAITSSSSPSTAPTSQTIPQSTTDTETKAPVVVETDAPAAPAVNGGTADVNGQGTKEKENVDATPHMRMGEKLRSSLDNLSLGGRKRAGSLKSEKGSVRSDLSVKDRLKEKLVK